MGVSSLLVLYVDAILFISNDVRLPLRFNHILSKSYEMKGLGEASFVLVIAIHRNMFRDLFWLSQRAYIDRVLRMLNTNGCAPGDAHIVKRDKFYKFHCPKIILRERY